MLSLNSPMFCRFESYPAHFGGGWRNWYTPSDQVEVIPPKFSIVVVVLSNLDCRTVGDMGADPIGPPNFMGPWFNSMTPALKFSGQVKRRESLKSQHPLQAPPTGTWVGAPFLEAVDELV